MTENELKKYWGKIGLELYELLQNGEDLSKEHYEAHRELLEFINPKPEICVNTSDQTMYCETCFKGGKNLFTCKYIPKQTEEHKKDRKRKDCIIPSCTMCLYMNDLKTNSFYLRKENDQNI